MRTMSDIGHAVPSSTCGLPVLWSDSLATCVGPRQYLGLIRIDRGSICKVWIFSTKGKLPRILVDRVVPVEIADQWCAEKAWDVCIVLG